MTDQNNLSRDYHKFPRLYIQDQTCHLTLSADITLDKDQTHYAHNVMRMKKGHFIRVFNGRDGDWLGQFIQIDKKQAVIRLQESIYPQHDMTHRVHLYFAPIKKNRMDFLIEKAVELGVSDLHPISMQFGQVHAINHDRITRQMVEASEQSERQSIPSLHDIISFQDMIGGYQHISAGQPPILCCLERADEAQTPLINAYIHDYRTKFNTNTISILIGPEGGFSPDEKNAIHSHKDMFHCVSLGKSILRAETAAISALSAISLI